MVAYMRAQRRIREMVMCERIEGIVQKFGCWSEMHGEWKKSERVSNEIDRGVGFGYVSERESA